MKSYIKVLLIVIGLLFITGCNFAGNSFSESVFHPVTQTPTPELTFTPKPTTIPEVTDVPEVTDAPEITDVPEVTPSPTPSENRKALYLTFDDGPSETLTEPLLAILDKYQVKATFFVRGKEFPDMIKKIHEAGHTIGLHSVSHYYPMVYASEEAFFGEMFELQDFIYDCIGIRPTLIRFPGGSSNSETMFNPGIMTRLTKMVKEKGLEYFDWNASTEDSWTEDPQVMLENAKMFADSSKYILLLHHPESKQSSLDAVELLIQWGIENNYEFKVLTPDSPKAHHILSN